MKLRKKDNRVEGSFSPEDSCKDSFKYRLVQEDGRYRFTSVKVEGAPGCQTGALERIVKELEGRYLDEIDLARIESLSCEHARGCPREIAQMIREIKELLLP